MNKNLDDQNFEKVLIILACVGLLFGLSMIKTPITTYTPVNESLSVEHTSENVIDLKQNLLDKKTQTKNILGSFNWGVWSWNQVNCLAANIYHEARGEPTEGQIAVGIVTLNRVKDSRWASTICDVVTQRNLIKYYDDNNEYKSKLVCQFSWYCTGAEYNRVDQAAWNKSVELSYSLLYSNKYDSLIKRYQNAYYFHSASADPAWVSRVKLIKQTGSHLFYEDF